MEVFGYKEGLIEQNEYVLFENVPLYIQKPFCSVIHWNKARSQQTDEKSKKYHKIW